MCSILNIDPMEFWVGKRISGKIIVSPANATINYFSISKRQIWKKSVTFSRNLQNFFNKKLTSLVSNRRTCAWHPWRRIYVHFLFFGLINRDILPEIITQIPGINEICFKWDLLRSEFGDYDVQYITVDNILTQKLTSRNQIR